MMSEERETQLNHFLASLGVPVSPTSLSLYDQALTHSSFTYEYKLSSTQNYERLEFLGDAVLKLIVSDYLFERFPHYREGELTKIRAVIVSDSLLARFAQQLNLGTYLIFGPNEARSGGQNKVSNLACAFESFLGALFLDDQMAFATAFVKDLVGEEVTKVDLSKTKDNYKAVLQEFTQGDGDGLPEYRTVKEEGPPHSRVFHVDVLINDEVLGSGTGKSKKEAQQMAAKMALQCLNQLSDEEAAADAV
jgi:ribonuclease III